MQLLLLYDYQNGSAGFVVFEPRDIWMTTVYECDT